MSKQTIAQLSWEPRRVLNRYCAPACGRGCTWQEYQHAVASADELVKQMKGSGWEPVVWENIGWHWKIVSGPVQVHPGYYGGFWCMIGASPTAGSGGPAFWTPQQPKHFKDPNRAVTDALLHVWKFVDRVTETLAAAKLAAGVTGPKSRNRVHAGPSAAQAACQLTRPLARRLKNIEVSTNPDDVTCLRCRRYLTGGNDL
jgi:hypothetical protein